MVEIGFSRYWDGDFVPIARSLRKVIFSMPSWELFEEQSQDYRDRVLPPDITARVAVEQASTLGWERYVGRRGHLIGVHTFGAVERPVSNNQERITGTIILYSAERPQSIRKR